MVWLLSCKDISDVLLQCYLLGVRLIQADALRSGISPPTCGDALVSYSLRTVAVRLQRSPADRPRHSPTTLSHPWSSPYDRPRCRIHLATNTLWFPAARVRHPSGWCPTPDHAHSSRSPSDPLGGGLGPQPAASSGATPAADAQSYLSQIAQAAAQQAVAQALAQINAVGPPPQVSRGSSSN